MNDTGTGKNVNILVVDNDSRDNSLKLLESFLKGSYFTVDVIRNKENLGYASGNNVGINFALGKGAKYILLLNPDMILSHGTISSLIADAEANPKTGIIGPKIYVAGSSNRIWSCGGAIDSKRYTAGLIGFNEIDSDQYERKREVDYISGAAMLVRKEVFESVGLFYTPYFLYYEDADLCLRTRLRGFSVVFNPSLVFNHDFSSSVGRYSPMKQYYMARNHMLFVERNAPKRVFVREFLRLPKTVFEHCVEGDFYSLLGVRDYFLRRFGKHDYWR